MTTPQDEPTNNQQLELQRLRTFEHLVSNAMAQRANYFNKLLDPRRNLNKECGYPETQSITPDEYRNLYDRESIATRVVQVEPKETWQITPEVYEDEDNDTQTPFEVAWDELSKTLRGQSWYCDEKASPIWEHLLRADILSGIGHFGVLLLGVDDGQQLQFPIEGTPGDGFATDITGVQDANGGQAKPLDTAYGSPVATQPVGQGQLSSVLGTDAQYFNSYNPGQAPERKKGEALKLIFLRAFDESLVQIVQYESLITNPRFGQPIMYLITLNDPKEQHSGVGLPLATVRVHWSRVIHIADNLGSSEIFGVPRMRPVYNRLLDLAKLYGGSAEGYWRGAFPGLSIETHPQLGGDVSIDQTQMRDMMDNYYNKLDRGLSLTGMTAKSLAPMVVDPTPQIDGEIQAICIEKSVPKRVFMGSERGELASSEDADTWDNRLNGRRNGYVTPRIIVPFVDRLILIGVLPEPGGEVDEEDTEDVTENASTIAKTGVAAEVVNEPESGIPAYSSGKVKADKEKKKAPGYHVKWPDMDEESPDSVAKNALARTQALAAYISGGCESVMDPLDYLVNELKYDEEVAKIIIEHSMKHLEDSYPDTEDEIMPGHVPAPPAPELPPNSPIKMGQGETLFDPNGGGVMHETKPAPKAPVKNEEAEEKVEQPPELTPEEGDLLDSIWDRQEPVDNGGPGSGPRPGHGSHKTAKKSKADVYYGLGFPEKIDQRAKDILGTDDPIAIASLVGAPDDAEVTMVARDESIGSFAEGYTERKTLEIEIKHEKFTATRQIEKTADGELVMHNVEFFINKEHQGAGIGTEVFSNQVANAKEMGISKIVTHAARVNPRDPKNPHNGYYTWARFGYDAKLEPDIVRSPKAWKDLQKKHPDAKNVSDLMKTKEGRDFWKANGDDFEGTFSLAKDSLSTKVLDSYTTERAAKSVTSNTDLEFLEEFSFVEKGTSENFTL